MISNKALLEITGEVKNYIRFLSDLGCKGFECSARNCDTVMEWGVRKSVHEKKSIVPETLETIYAEMGDCRRCGLAANRTHLVYGAGNPGARLVFVGGAPDSEEDVQGLPFVGEGGQLLTRMIQAMGLSREDVYICNIVKCRPAENKTPGPEEFRACLAFFERQVQVIKPEIICTLGAFATRILLKNRAEIANLRGEFQDYKGIKILPTFHPSFLLKNPGNKREAWEDLQKIMTALRLQRKTK